MGVSFSTFFGDDPEMLRDLDQASTSRRYSGGSLIAGEGDEDTSVLYILDGKANALRYAESGIEVFIDTFAAGDLVGELAVLGGGRRTADIYAQTDMIIAVFPGAAFIKLMEKHGAIGLRVSRLLANRIQKTTRRMFEQSTLSSKGRVYAELMRMADKNDGAGHLTIKNMPSISEVARRLGIARETVSRTVNELRHAATIKSSGADLVILAPQDIISRLH